MSIEEKIKAVVELSVDLEHAFMEAAHELRGLTDGTPASRATLEHIIRASISRGRYDAMLRKLIEGAVAAGHLHGEYINGVIAGLQDRRDEAGAIARQFVLADQAGAGVN